MAEGTAPPATEPDEGKTPTTNYLILESRDGGITWRYFADQLAYNSENALRSYFDDETVGVFVAVAESSFRPKQTEATVKIRLTEFEMPSPSDEPVPTEDVAPEGDDGDQGKLA